ncbi:MAG: GTP pyrophosphokinase [Pseudomonadota bacterium]
MTELDRALQIMAAAHVGQLDKGGEPYVLHPIRVMLRVESAEERIVALLHDVVEDSSITLSSLKQEGFSHEILVAVGCLTKKDGEPYDDFIRRISLNKLATKVKIADLKENLDTTRLTELTEHDLRRIQKYHRALNTLVHGL